jgi:hypothetical protein
MGKVTPIWISILLIFLVLSGVVWVVITPTDPEPFTNKPVQTIEVKFLQERSTHISLGRDAEMRLAVPAEGPNHSTIPVVCPRGFNPDPAKTYTVDGFRMTDETGRFARYPIWILRNKTEDIVQLVKPLPNIGEFIVKK